MKSAANGYALMETLVTLLLSMIVGAILCAALLAQSRVARAIGERIAYNDAARTTLHILPRELRLSSPLKDIHAVASDSIAGRWVRGSGAVCALQGGFAWLRIRGVRAPDPDKDSILLISSGAERVIAFSDVSADQQKCTAATGERIYRVPSATSIGGGGAGIIFETGSYYLSQRALRYRIGGEGRQPLTEEFLRDAGSGLQLFAADTTRQASLRITISLKPASQHTAGRTEAATIMLLNGTPGS